MRWEPEAEALLKRVPFFVRGRVKKKVEEFVRSRGREVVTAEEMLAAREALREKAASATEGFAVEGCFGSTGCPNAVTNSAELLERLEEILRQEDLTGFLRQKVGGPLKHHHQFRVALAECPNACSQVQIRDFALIGQAEITLSEDACSFCGECEKICEEGAIKLTNQGPRLNEELCLRCAACVHVCPTEALRLISLGYRVLIGGKLGRHPRLASELVSFASPEEIPPLLRRVVNVYKRYNQHGERLGSIIQRVGWERIREEILK